MSSADSVDFSVEVSAEDVAREKRRARELRQSQWWKNRRGEGRCHYCRRALPARELTMDHIVPIIRGGKSTKSNIVPCCKACNAKKRYLLPAEWREYMESLASRGVQP
jgi:5-methylcytosine-specific restriction endonuclease McrA